MRRTNSVFLLNILINSLPHNWSLQTILRRLGIHQSIVFSSLTTYLFNITTATCAISSPVLLSNAKQVLGVFTAIKIPRTRLLLLTSNTMQSNASVLRLCATKSMGRLESRRVPPSFHCLLIKAKLPFSTLTDHIPIWKSSEYL